tara:strand:+ start:10163 stop:11311 length:1149 start_codon:yes stop_codon:yes gene_type:complete
MYKISTLYKTFISPILAKDNGIDPEFLTNSSLYLIDKIANNKESFFSSNFVKSIKNECIVSDTKLSQNLFGVEFKNPIGLAAGFDKNGIGVNIWEDFGFGFAEIGTTTWHPQPGNPKPRLFRLSKEKAALNRLGFNNDGAKKLSDRLMKNNYLTNKNVLKLGINFGKSKITPLELASEDYLSSLKLLSKFCDYGVINVSSPNTPNLRTLQDPKLLKDITSALKEIDNCPPLFIKIAPDLSLDAIDSICDLALEENITGIIATNTSLDRLALSNRILFQTGKKLSEEEGGLSGKPLTDKANQIINHLYDKKTKLVLIGVGGIHSPRSAWNRLASGASLIQIYTGWIYEGPKLVPNILYGILKQMKLHKLNNIKEVIGSKLPWI